MTKTFQYKEKLSLLLFWQCVIGIAIIGYGCWGPFDLRWRNLTLLRYPYSCIFFVISGVVILYFVMEKMLRYRASRKTMLPIVMSEHDIEFNHLVALASVRLKVLYNEIERFDYNMDDEEGRSITIITKKPRKEYLFAGKNFQSHEKFQEFKSALHDRCPVNFSELAAG